MNAGDELTAADAAMLSGLTEGVCRAMFEGLARAGLMSAEADGRFVRQTVDVSST